MSLYVVSRPNRTAFDLIVTVKTDVSFFFISAASRELSLKGKYHENLLPFQNPKCLTVSRNNEIILSSL